jgi:hypothetical protein
MGIEALNSAARAAGFAMATPDDDTPVDELVAETVVEPAWRPGAPLLLGAPGIPQAHSLSVAEWLKGLFGSVGRGTPAEAR